MIKTKTTRYPDRWLLGVTLALLLLGILILASVSATISQEKFGTTYYYLNHQLLYGILPGLILGFIAFKIRLEKLRKWAPGLLLVSLILLTLVFIPGIGTDFGGTAKSWLNFRIFSFQPSEILKLTFILYLAAWFASRAEKQRKGFSQTLIAFLIVIGLIGLLLVFQPDIGTFGIIAAYAAFMYFLAGTPIWHSILILLAGAASLFALIKLAPYRAARFLVLLKPETDPMGIGYQIKQALIAVGSGGILGLGLGMSRQKFGLLPQPMSDSIFAIFAEETGFIGSLILILLFLIFFWRGFKIAKQTEDKFLKLTALGISCWIILQTFVNIGSMIGILPLTGIPLPFIGYGGSALIVEMIGVGILLNISKQIKN